MEETQIPLKKSATIKDLPTKSDKKHVVEEMEELIESERKEKKKARKAKNFLEESEDIPVADIGIAERTKQRKSRAKVPLTTPMPQSC